MNQCTFIGNLTRDPRLTTTKNGSRVASVGIATNRFYKKGDGETSVESTYLEFEAWDTGAERIAEIFKKGDQIAIEASAKNVSWVDDDGLEHRRIVFRINRFYPLSKKHKPQEI